MMGQVVRLSMVISFAAVLTAKGSGPGWSRTRDSAAWLADAGDCICSVACSSASCAYAGYDPEGVGYLVCEPENN